MSVWVVCSRLILIASLWQTPLPLIDYHCAAPQTAAEFQHFAKFHAPADLCHCNLGWHMHFVWAQRPDAPAPSKVPSSDDPDQGGSLLCSVDSALESSRQGELGARPVALFVQPAETTLSVHLNLQRDLAGRVHRPPPAAQDICTRLCTWQC